MNSFLKKLFSKNCNFWMISCIFEPHMHHEKIRYSPISLWMYEIRLRDTVNVYFKYNYYIQFQRKKGMNMHKRHFGHRQNQKKNYSETFQKNVSRIGSQMTWNSLKRQENVSWKWCLPISSKIHKICLRETIEVYYKLDHCIQFQGKKPMNIRWGHPLNSLKNVRWFLASWAS